MDDALGRTQYCDDAARLADMEASDDSLTCLLAAIVCDFLRSEAPPD